MKIACYSDLHLEFEHNWQLPSDLSADILILAGDIIIFDDFLPFKELLKDWSKPVVFVAGNHEYYTKRAMLEHNESFKAFLRDSLPQVHFLQNEPVNINGVNFFGGTMWTDFKGGDSIHMRYAENNMSDFRLITANGLRPLSARETLGFHQEFLKALKAWLSKKINGPRVVVTHHVPFENQLSKFLESPLQPAFIAYDAPPVISKYQPDIWICGHTHESFKHDLGKTKIISNQLGYPLRDGGYESGDNFDKYGIGLQL